MVYLLIMTVLTVDIHTDKVLAIYQTEKSCMESKAKISKDVSYHARIYRCEPREMNEKIAE